MENYEQKYKEALEKAKKLYSQHDIEWCDEDIVYVFPELSEHAEREDKRIRKEIISFLKEGEPYYCPNCVKRQEWVAWFEKQGEQKPISITDEWIEDYWQNNPYSYDKGDEVQFDHQGFVGFCKKYCKKPTNEEMKTSEMQKSADKVEPKFKIGNWVVLANNKVKQIEEVTFGDYLFTDKTLYNIIDVDNKGHLWTIQDAKDGDVLVFDDIIMIFKNIKTVCTANTYILYCDGIVVDDWCDFGYNAHPATKEQRDLLFQKMKEAGYEWDDEKKKLKKIENPIWSEEDEKMFFGLISIVEGWYNTMSEEEKEYYGDCGYIDWLKSLKERIKK